jgi:hypothetical protein
LFHRVIHFGKTIYEHVGYAAKMSGAEATTWSDASDSLEIGVILIKVSPRPCIDSEAFTIRYRKRSGASVVRSDFLCGCGNKVPLVHRFINTAAYETCYQIPPDLPLRKGGEDFPLYQRGLGGIFA